MARVTWIVKINDGGWAEDTDATLTQIIDSIDRYARAATIHVIASAGRTIREDYPSFEPVRIYYDAGAGEVLKMVGFVVGCKENLHGADVEIVSGDFLLRRRSDIFVSYVASNISLILQNLIENYSPLEWDAGNISIVNDRVLTREWRGTRLDQIIHELATLSGNEIFGCDNDLKFFFRERDLTIATMSFSDNNIIAAETEIDETEAVDRVVLYFNSGNNAITSTRFDRGADNQATVGTVRPILRTAEYDHPEIVAEADAEMKARSYLDQGEPLNLITIKTAGFPALAPGQIVKVTSTELGISVQTEYVITEVEWNPRGYTFVKLLANSEGVVDILNALVTEKTRVDMKTSDATIAVVETNRVQQAVQVKITHLTIRTPVLDTGFFRWGAFGESFGGDGMGGTLGSPFLSYSVDIDESY